MGKISIRMLSSAAGRNLLLRKGEVIDDAPEEFMRSAVETGIAEWVVSPEQAEKSKRRRKKTKSEK